MKVFSIEKYKEDMGYTDEEVSEWAKKIAGWTLEDIQAKTLFGIASDWIEEVNMTKKDLRYGDLVTLKNGDKLFYNGKDLRDINVTYCNPVRHLYNINDDLTYKEAGKDKYDIVKVERPVVYKSVFEREEETQELTVDEISERLGYKVKVVGEDR